MRDLLPYMDGLCQTGGRFPARECRPSLALSSYTRGCAERLWVKSALSPDDTCALGGGRPVRSCSARRGPSGPGLSSLTAFHVALHQKEQTRKAKTKPHVEDCGCGG